MKHSLEAFSRDIINIIKTSGDTGDSGDKSEKCLRDSDNFVLTCCAEVSPLDSEWGHLVSASGDKKGKVLQLAGHFVPSVPTVPTHFEQHRHRASTGSFPSEWYAILEGLKGSEAVDWLTAERYQALIDDAESFLSRWGTVAHQLGWTAVDLFGVHPIAPAARFDVMGLLSIGVGLGPLIGIQKGPL